MKALLCKSFGPIDQLRLEEVATPEPGAAQVRVRVNAASLNFPDALIVQGLYQAKPALPFSPGAELAGVIDAIGQDVQGWKVGDQVIASTGHGAFAEQCLANASKLTALPAGMDYDMGAAFVLTYGTLLHALQQRARLQAGETPLVMGAAGGVGLAAIEIAKVMGARVIAAASTDDKLALCREGLCCSGSPIAASPRCARTTTRSRPIQPGRKAGDVRYCRCTITACSSLGFRSPGSGTSRTLPIGCANTNGTHSC